MSVSLRKNPAKVAAGQAGARARWGDLPKTVRLDELNADERRLVLALVNAAKAAKAVENAA